MRPEFLSFCVNGHYFIGANLGLRVIILQPDARTVAYDVDFQANADENFFLSRDGEMLAGAFSSEAFCCIEVVDLRRGAIITSENREEATSVRLERTHALSVAIAPDNETLFYWKHGAKQGTYAFHLPTSRQQKIPNASFPTNGAWLNDAVIIPCDRGRGGIRVSYLPLTVTPVELPSKANVWRLSAHPGCETLAMLTMDNVVALRADTFELLWQDCIPSVDWVSYSGNGLFIAVRQRASAGGPVQRIVLLDAVSGETIHVVEGPEQALYPLDGSRFLCYSGRFLNAETGELEEGVSSPSFWDAIVKRSS